MEKKIIYTFTGGAGGSDSLEVRKADLDATKVELMVNGNSFVLDKTNALDLAQLLKNLFTP